MNITNIAGRIPEPRKNACKGLVNYFTNGFSILQARILRKHLHLLPVMPTTEFELFDLLKKEIADTYRQTYPSCSAPIELWKGQDIINFQEELMMKVKGRISEKWFYTHIKTKGDKLPRIDMLNMLSEYANYQDWRDFTTKNKDFTKEKQEQVAPIIELHPEMESPVEVPVGKSSKNYLRWILAGICLLILAFLVFKKNSKTYRCCFTDLNGGPLVANAHVEVKLLNADESPIIIACDENGCFELKTTSEQIRFFVSSPYYKPDTIIRFLDKDLHTEQLKLQTNDYALMIHYFSTAKLNDWKQRRMKLEDMITADAKIFQVYMDGSGMELYNKQEFINKLTMPLKSLKNIEIIETHYANNRISLLRFMQVEERK